MVVEIQSGALVRCVVAGRRQLFAVIRVGAIPMIVLVFLVLTLLVPHAIDPSESGVVSAGCSSVKICHYDGFGSCGTLVRLTVVAELVEIGVQKATCVNGGMSTQCEWVRVFVAV